VNERRLDGFGWLFLVIGGVSIVNALWMLVGPMHWYTDLPTTAPHTGPFNPHFVRDIGCAFLTVGIALVWAARASHFRVPLAATAALFLVFHALLHIWDTGTGALDVHHFWLDLPGVYLPAVLTGWAAFTLARRGRAATA
jgi:hypothetical protein